MVKQRIRWGRLRLFKLLRYLNVATVIHKWLRIGALAHQRYLDKMLQKRKTEPVAVPLDFEPERCTLTMKPEISTRASLLPILRLGPLLLSRYLFQPTPGREGEKRRPLDHMWQIPFVLTAQFRSDYPKSQISNHMLEKIVIVSSMW